ncbi:hypothetical protein [Gulosibacter sediminis]|nr:hypothetical protein [Gulosibacter sediminis]
MSIDPISEPLPNVDAPPHVPDVVSDPAENIEPGSDWADEGGAVEKGHDGD